MKTYYVCSKFIPKEQAFSPEGVFSAILNQSVKGFLLVTDSEESLRRMGVSDEEIHPLDLYDSTDLN